MPFLKTFFHIQVRLWVDNGVKKGDDEDIHRMSLPKAVYVTVPYGFTVENVKRIFHVCCTFFVFVDKNKFRTGVKLWSKS